MGGNICIPVPNTCKESRLEDVLMALFFLMDETERQECKVVWDYQNIRYMHPFFTSFLAVYKDARHGLVEDVNVSEELQNLFNLVRVQAPVLVDNRVNFRQILDTYRNNAIIPMCKFALGYERIDSFQTLLQTILREQIKDKDHESEFITGFSYLLGELICNIQEHSCASYGYVGTQYLESDNSLYVCIADNGITIHGSYMSFPKGEYIRLIGNDEAEALRFSTKGISTKNLPDNESRGYGISTNLRMVVDGLGGTFLLLSGNAFLKIDNQQEQFVNLPKGINWDGTMILVRMPLKQSGDFSVYAYIE